MKWKTVIGYKKPLELEVGVTTVYFRREITEIVDREGNQAWEYKEAQISLVEFKERLKSLASYNKGFVSPKKQDLVLEDFFLNQAEILLETEYQNCLMELNFTI